MSSQVWVARCSRLCAISMVLAPERPEFRWVVSSWLVDGGVGAEAGLCIQITNTDVFGCGSFSAWDTVSGVSALRGAALGPRLQALPLSTAGALPRSYSGHSPCVGTTSCPRLAPFKSACLPSARHPHLSARAGPCGPMGWWRRLSAFLRLRWGPALLVFSF